MFATIQTHKSQIEKSNQELERLRFKQDQDYLSLSQQLDVLKKKADLTSDELTKVDALVAANKEQAFSTGFPQIPPAYKGVAEESWPSETKLHSLAWTAKAYQQLPALPSQH